MNQSGIIELDKNIDTNMNINLPVKAKEIIRRLSSNKKFIRMISCASEQKTSRDKLLAVNSIRERFNLSPFWSEWLLLKIENPKVELSKAVAGGALIEPARDPITKKIYYKVCIYPETTQKDILKAYSIIHERQTTDGTATKIRTSKRFDDELYALKRSREGISHKKIRKELNSKSGKNYYTENIAGLIYKAKTKLKE